MTAFLGFALLGIGAGKTTFRTAPFFNLSYFFFLYILMKTTYATYKRYLGATHQCF